MYVWLCCSACSLKIHSNLCYKDIASFLARFAPLPSLQTFISLVFEFREFPWVQRGTHSHLTFVSFSLSIYILLTKYLLAVLRLCACIYVSIYNVFCCCLLCAVTSCLLILCVVSALILCFVLAPFAH